MSRFCSAASVIHIMPHITDRAIINQIKTIYGRYSTAIHYMMTSSNGNIVRVNGPLWKEFTGHWGIPHTKASDAELWCFLWSAPEQTVEHTIATPVIWSFETQSRSSLWHHCNAITNPTPTPTFSVRSIASSITQVRCMVQIYQIHGSVRKLLNWNTQQRPAYILVS